MSINTFPTSSPTEYAEDLRPCSCTIRGRGGDRAWRGPNGIWEDGEGEQPHVRNEAPGSASLFGISLYLFLVSDSEPNGFRTTGIGSKDMEASIMLRICFSQFGQRLFESNHYTANRDQLSLLDKQFRAAKLTSESSSEQNIAPQHLFRRGWYAVSKLEQSKKISKRLSISLVSD